MRNILIVIAFLLSLMVCQRSEAQSTLSSAERKVYDKALALADKTNNREAVRLLRELYDSHPDNIDVAYNLGVCYINMSGNPDSALFFLDKVRKFDSGSSWTDSRVDLYLAIARVEQLCERPQDALKTYDELQPNVSDSAVLRSIAKQREICNNAIVLMDNPVHVEYHRMDDGVNSQFNDYRPVLSPSEDTLYFTSRRYKPDADPTLLFDDGQFEEGVYMSVRHGDRWSASWDAAKQVRGLVLNKKGVAGQETASSLATYLGKQELYICHDGDIYVSLRDTVSGDWYAAEILPQTINTAFDEEGAFVTPDGQDMYFSSNCPGGFGGKDIYVSHRLPNGEWGEALNLGAGVNTSEDEEAPFFHVQSNVLYFSSCGHNTMGGYDIFVSPKGDNGCFEAVQNLGYPINSADDDMYFVPSVDHDRAYYSSIRWNSDSKAPSFDIYEVEFEQPEQNRMALVAALVQAPDDSNVSILTISDGEVVGICRPNPRTNRFVSIVEVGKTYELLAVLNGDTIRQTVTTSKADSYFFRRQPIELDAFVFMKHSSVFNNAGDYASNVTVSSAIRSSKSSGSYWNSWVTSDSKPYTVQFLSLRHPVDPKLIKGIDHDNVAEYVYRDGWFVYSYGSFSSYREAVSVQQHIRATTPFKDAFSRNSNQYKKFLKKPVEQQSSDADESRVGEQQQQQVPESEGPSPQPKD